MADWDSATTHVAVNEAVPEGTELPEDWDGMTIAAKKEWLDANVVAEEPEDGGLDPEAAAEEPAAEEPAAEEPSIDEDGAAKLATTKDY
jgi:hypothetical protein